MYITRRHIAAENEIMLVAGGMSSIRELHLMLTLVEKSALGVGCALLYVFRWMMISRIIVIIIIFIFVVIFERFLAMRQSVFIDFFRKLF